MPNGDDAIWKAIDGLRDDVKDIAVKGCAFREPHQKSIDDEKKERREDMTTLSKKMDSIRNQVIIGVLLVMALALVVDKILK